MSRDTIEALLALMIVFDIATAARCWQRSKIPLDTSMYRLFMLLWLYFALIAAIALVVIAAA